MPASRRRTAPDLTIHEHKITATSRDETMDYTYGTNGLSI